MKANFLFLGVLAASLAKAGTYSLVSASWYGGDPTYTKNEHNLACSASISGTTTSWEVWHKIHQQADGGEFGFDSITAYVQYKILWIPSSPTDAPPNSAPVTFFATGAMYARAYAVTQGTEHSEARMHVDDSCLLQQKNAEAVTDGGSPEGFARWASQEDGSMAATINRTWTTDLAHPAQFNNVNGQWVAFILQPVTPVVFYNIQRKTTYSTSNYAEGEGHTKGTLKLIAVGGQDVTGGAGGTGGGGTSPGGGGSTPPGGGPTPPGGGSTPPGGGGFMALMNIVWTLPKRTI